MLSTAIFPGRYVQGEQAISVLGKETSRQGKNALILCDPYVYMNLLDEIHLGMGEDIEYHIQKFSGECSNQEINRLKLIAKKQNCDVIIGVGGGKTLDTAKAVAYLYGTKSVIVPTIASTDAPCSALSVIYTPDGHFNQYLLLPQSPDVVIVDTQLIAEAPARFLVSGMGDAFATWFEAEDCRRKGGKNMTGNAGSMTAYYMAKLCHDTLLEYGKMAKTSCEQHVVIPAFDCIVEANILLSGIGYESGGLAAAHAIHNGLTVMEPTHQFWHGEKMAIGLQVMMFLEDRPASQIDRVFDFCQSIGLPIRLTDIGLEDISDEDLMHIAKAACADGETIHTEATEVSPAGVFAALKFANSEGERRKSPTLKNRF